MRAAPPRLSLLASLALSVAGLASLAVGAGAPGEGVRFFADARAQQSVAPDRVVALGGVITEIAYAVGAQDKIVGVDSTSVFPPEALRDKPNVGYVRALSAEGVLSLKPSLILAIEGAGPPDAMKLIAETGVRMISLREDHTADGVVARIREVAALLGEAGRGETIARETAEKFRSLAAARSRIARPKRVLFALSLQNGRVMAGGRNTSADAIIQLAGAVNAVDSFEGYKTVADEAIIAAAPDYVLIMNRGGQTPDADQVFAMPSFATTPAAKLKGFGAMDGQYLLGFGPRAPDAARDLMQAIYGASVAGKT